MFRRLASSVLAVGVLGMLAVPAYSATQVFQNTWNFDATDSGANPDFFKTGAVNTPAASTTFTAGANTHLAPGTHDGLLGPYGNTAGLEPLAFQSPGVHVTVGSGSYNAVTISFQLWVINTWDGNNTAGGLGPDYFQVGVSSGGAGSFVAPVTACGGSSSVFCESFANGAGSQSYSGAAAYNGYGQGSGTFGNTLAPSGYSIYNITLTEVPVTPVGGQITVFFAGWQNQSSSDESWALSNVSITGLLVDGNGPGPGPGPGEIPEPSTMVLGGLGLAFIAFASKKFRKS